MTHDERLKVYTRGLTNKTQDGTYRLTPAQRRRARRKFNRSTKT